MVNSIAIKRRSISAPTQVSAFQALKTTIVIIIYYVYNLSTSGIYV